MNTLVEKPPNIIKVLRRKTEKSWKHVIKKVFLFLGEIGLKNHKFENSVLFSALSVGGFN